MDWKAQSLGEVLERHARERGTAEALVTPAGRFTYEDMYLRSRSAATTMHTLGIRRGDHVGILMGNDEKWLALFYGAALIGAVTVPVNTRFKAAEIDFCLKQADCKALFYVPRFLNIDFGAMVRETGFAKAFDITRALPEWSIGDPRTLSPQDTLLIQFTSGSVGTPKGIYLTLEAVAANVTAILAALEPGVGDGSCSWLPLSHDMGLIGQLLSPLAAGAARFGHHRLTLMKPDTFMANPRSWLRTCSNTQSTITVAPNFALELAVRTSKRIGALDLSRLRTIIVGSETVRADTLVRFADAFAAGASAATFSVFPPTFIAIGTSLPSLTW